MNTTPQQKQIIDSDIKNILVIAGPGTGKTYTLQHKILDLVSNKGINPSNICVLTFTRVATNELKKKISEALATSEQNSLPKIYTLHSFSLRQLMLNVNKIDQLPINFKIANDFEERWIIFEDIKDMLGIEVNEVKKLFNKLSSNWETLNADRSGWERSFDNPKFIGAWQQHRNIYGYVLRSELVYQLKKMLEMSGDVNLDSPINYLIVDEYQDLNKCDLEIIQQIATRGANLFCVGDDDQSIYGFRYAHPEGIRTFRQTYDESDEFQITECWRCDKDILNLALNVIEQDVTRIPKELSSKSPNSGEIHLLRFANERAEAEKVAFIVNKLIEDKNVPSNEIIILLRSDFNNNFSSLIKSHLENQKIALNKGNEYTSYFQQKAVLRFFAILKYINDEQNDLAIRTILQTTHGIGKKTLEKLYEKASMDNIRFNKVIEKILNQEYEFNTSNKVKEIIKEYINYKQKVDSENLSVNEILEFANSKTDDLPEEFDNWLNEFISSYQPDDLNSLLNLVDDLTRNIDPPDTDIEGVRIMTMHQAKGLTAQAVIIVGAEEEYLPGENDVNEERRLLYVSLTRAKNFLFITYCNKRIGVQRFSGFTRDRDNRMRNLTRYIRDLPLISPENGENFNFQ